MKLALGLLVGAQHHHDQLLGEWVARAGGAIGCIAHAYTGAYTGQTPALMVPTVPTTWAHTMGGHLALMRGMLNTDATHLLLVSESCFPAVAPAEALTRLCDDDRTRITPGLSFRTGQPPAAPWRIWWHPGDGLRKTHRQVHQALRGHEQWACISRRHAEMLLAHQDELWQWFGECFADNECYLATALAMFGQLELDVLQERVTWTRWPAWVMDGHPDTLFATDNAMMAQIRKTGAVMFRKLAPDARIGHDLTYLKPMSRRSKAAVQGARSEAAATPSVGLEATIAAERGTGAEQGEAWWAALPGGRILPAVLTAGVYNYLPGLEDAIAPHPLLVFDAGTGYAPKLATTLVVTISPRQWTGNWQTALEWIKLYNERYSHLWMMSDDIVLAPGSLPCLEAAMEAGVGIASLLFNSAHKPTRVRAMKGLYEDVPFVEFTAPVVSFAFLEAVGGLPTDNVRGWGVDLAFGVLARQGGWSVIAVAGADFHHVEALTNAAEHGSKADYHRLAASEMKGYLRKTLGDTWAEQVAPRTSGWLADWFYKI